MCVGLSARVVKIDKGVALIDTNGVRKNVSAELTDDLLPGDYVMVHAGTVIGKIKESSGEETSSLLEGLL